MVSIDALHITGVLWLDLTVCFAPNWTLILPMLFLICWKWITYFTQKTNYYENPSYGLPLVTWQFPLFHYNFFFISLQLCVNLLQYRIFISIIKLKQSKYFEWLLTFYKTNVFYCFSRYNNHGRQTFKSIKLLSFPLQSEMRVTIFLFYSKN